MNILVTCDRLDTMGGLEEHVTDKVKYLLEKGHRVHLDCNAIGSHYEKKIDHDNLSISSPWSTPWSNVLNDIGNFEPDIVHAHPFSAVERGYNIHKAFKDSKLFITIHGHYGYRVPNHICEAVSKMIVVNESIDCYNNICEVICIPNGINTTRFYSNTYTTSSLKRNVVVFATRLQDNKEIPVFEFIEACKYIFEPLDVYILGGGSYLEEVKRKIKESKISPDKVQFNVLGEVGNIEKYYNIADLVIGCDRVALEALCCDKNVFYAGQSYFKDLLTMDNFNDLFFTDSVKHSIKYTPRELADKIIGLLKIDISNLYLNQTNLYDYIRNEFSIDKQIQNILDLYK